MNMRPLKRKVSITLDEDLIERVRALSEEQARSFSQYLTVVLKEPLRSQDHTRNLDHYSEYANPRSYPAAAMGSGFLFGFSPLSRSRSAPSRPLS